MSGTSLRTVAWFGVALVPGLIVLSLIWISVGADGISPVTHKLPVVDFANVWSAGKLARHRDLATLFDTDAYRAWLRAQFSPRYQNSEWSYPPPVILLGVPLSLLGIVPAYLVWIGVTAVVLFATLRYSGLSQSVAIAVMFSPAMLENVTFGQNGALTAALLWAALLLVSAKPNGAGIGAGLLIIKPQFGILLPIALIARRSWRVIAVAIMAAAALAALTAAAFGFDVWVLFWTHTRPLMVSVLEQPWQNGYLANGVTVYFSARSFGLGVPVAYGLQAVATLCAVGLVIAVWRKPDVDPTLRATFTAPLVLLATPYAYTYDLVAFAVANAVIMQRRGWRIGPVTAVAWIWPGLSHFYAIRGWLLMPFILIGFAAVVWRELRRDLVSQPRR